MVLTNDPEPVWDKETDVPKKWIEFVDENVATSKLSTSDFDFSRDNDYELRNTELPPGSQIKGISPCGFSYWTRTARIETEKEDGTQLSFFLKVAK